MRKSDRVKEQLKGLIRDYLSYYLSKGHDYYKNPSMLYDAITYFLNEDKTHFTKSDFRSYLSNFETDIRNGISFKEASNSFLIFLNAIDSKKLNWRLIEHFKTISLNPMIKTYEEKGKRILNKEGYPTDWKKLSGYKQPLPERIRNIENMFFRFEEVLNCVSKNDAGNAAWNMGLALQAFFWASVGPGLKYIDSGEKSFKAGKEGAERKAEIKKTKERDKYIQEQADKFWKINPGASIKEVALLILSKNKHIHLSVDRLRHIIKRLQ